VTEDDLLRGIREGDPKAEEDFDRQFRPPIAKLLAVGFRIPAQDSEDLTQRTLFRAIAAIRGDRFRRDSTLKTWITSIAINAARDYRRALKRNAALDTDSNLAGLPAPRGDPETRIAVERALATLRPRFQAVLQLWAQGWTTYEIAKVLRLSPGRTGAILAEAKEAFRTALRREGFGQR
jgi:RNA polymerase sigma factor, sigma-70 family